MNKNKFDFESGVLTSEQTAKLQELMAVLEKANNDLKNLISCVGDKIDTRELTPMGRVIKEFNIRTEDNFINWMSVYEKELLENERELIESAFIIGHEYADYEMCADEYFQTNFKQTL